MDEKLNAVIFHSTQGRALLSAAALGNIAYRLRRLDIDDEMEREIEAVCHQIDVLRILMDRSVS